MRSPDDIYGNMIGKPPSKFSYQFSLVEEKNQTGRRKGDGGLGGSREAGVAKSKKCLVASPKVPGKAHMLRQKCCS